MEEVQKNSIIQSFLDQEFLSLITISEVKLINLTEINGMLISGLVKNCFIIFILL